jgi:hypothetical protein
MYTAEPEDKKAFTQRYDQAYGSFVRVYDWIVKALPIWRNWISTAIPPYCWPTGFTPG